MPDITMCKGVEHDKCNNCYRKRAIPSEFRQAYFTDPPMQKGGICTWYSKIREHDRVVEEAK